MKDFSRDLWRILWADKSALLGAILILCYGLVAIFGPMFVHLSTFGHQDGSYLPPSPKHLLGTDTLGQDILAEIIVGTRPIMVVGLLAATITTFVGVVIGLVTGYLGGWVDVVVMRIVDIALTIPGLPLIIVIAAVIHSSNPFVLAAILSVTGWAGLARAVRSQAISLRTMDFMAAARIQGLPLRNIVGRQLLPNVGPYVAIHFLLGITGAIYAEVGLFLLGVAPLSGTNWGIMINLAMSQGALYTSKSILYLLAPMASIVVLQVAFVFFSRALDSLFNPRLRVQ
ncbi:ABC transporter permease [Actinopolymorpha singaporensis]|uniref:Peptide/nickel transport system permease protein n=1 Tax=Actinopolymorpha singaporensis TaxID=117157 RepID=A0A1H1TZY7_9ACTN|nr:ABC transporter permease [Actinopolymorpha singaporensis]SDS65641.1 peptide/nickel transport system permease protein [Actinopolymorpha singaporensis]